MMAYIIIRKINKFIVEKIIAIKYFKKEKLRKNIRNSVGLSIVVLFEIGYRTK